MKRKPKSTPDTFEDLWHKQAEMLGAFDANKYFDALTRNTNKPVAAEVKRAIEHIQVEISHWWFVFKGHLWADYGLTEKDINIRLNNLFEELERLKKIKQTYKL